ncbi:MAG: hypothetical protein C6I00_03805 [Nitratiruptor sp.]|nr:hypothetical protein [Nitratiruptor sp.]NPA83907.1 hypothetical protein [Campylobacterota bacterium]
MRCDYCQRVEPLALPSTSITYRPLQNHLPNWEDPNFLCASCGASFQAKPFLHAGECPYCQSPLVAPSQNGYELPYAIPFALDEGEALARLRRRIGSLWFAPNDFKRFFKQYKKLRPFYYPAWIYRFRVRASYTGQRGIDYVEYRRIYTNRGYREVPEIRTRWYLVHGVVDLGFEDIYAFSYTQTPMLARRLLYRPQEVVPFDERLLAGQEGYEFDTSTKQGFTAAQGVVEGALRQAIRRDIGGDRQIISSIQRHFYDVEYSGLYLPLFWGSVEYRGKIYPFFVNGQTGEVIGERPYSWLKILLAVASTLAFIVALLWLLEYLGYIEIEMPAHLLY